VVSVADLDGRQARLLADDGADEEAVVVVGLAGVVSGMLLYIQGDQMSL
jgi:hypothetical protein